MNSQRPQTFTILVILFVTLIIGTLITEKIKSDKSKIGFRIIELQGNKVVSTHDYPPGRFIYIVSQLGTYYADTGNMVFYTLENGKQINQEQLKIVIKNLFEIANRNDK